MSTNMTRGGIVREQVAEGMGGLPVSEMNRDRGPKCTIVLF